VSVELLVTGQTGVLFILLLKSKIKMVTEVREPVFHCSTLSPDNSLLNLTQVNYHHLPLTFFSKPFRERG